jgi:hypothetical protein
MRVNVYTEELLTGNDAAPFAEIVTANYISSRTGEPMTNYGLRIFMKSAPELHYIPGRDDDRSAVTFWCGPSQKNIFNFIEMVQTFANQSKMESWRKKTLAIEAERRNTPDIESTKPLTGPRHKDDSGRMIPCLDYYDGKCQSLTHMCIDCPDRHRQFTGTGPLLDRDKLREQDTFGGFRPK